MILTVPEHTLVDPQGSVVLIQALTETGQEQWFATETRIAYDVIALAEQRGGLDVEVESWQLWGGPR